MVLGTAALLALVEIHRARSGAEGRDHCSDLAADVVRVLVGYTGEVEWELVEDRARSTGIKVE